MDFSDILQGKKAKYCALGIMLLTAVLEGLKLFNVITPEQASGCNDLLNKVYVILFGGALYGLAMKGDRTEKAVNQIKAECNGKTPPV